MDNLFVYKLVEEIRQQCRFALFAFQNLRQSVQALDSERAFFYAHAFLDHADNLSRLFWPARPQSASRGERLRQELHVAAESPLRMTSLRAQLQDVDARLEDWIGGLENRNYVDMNVMPMGTIADFKPDSFHRSLDPEEFKLFLRGAGGDLRQLQDEVRRVEGAAQAWLRTHNPW